MVVTLLKGEGSGFKLKYLKQPDNHKEDDQFVNQLNFRPSVTFNS